MDEKDATRIPPDKGGSGGNSEGLPSEGSDGEQSITTDFGTFKNREELLTAVTKAMKDSEAKVTDTSTKYSELLESYTNLLMGGKGEKGQGGTEKSAAPDWETLEATNPDLVATLKGLYQIGTDLTKRINGMSYGQDANALAAARQTAGFGENEADVRAFIKKHPADAIMANLSMTNPKLAQFAGNPYLAGFECWKLFTDKGAEYSRNAKAKTFEPSPGGGGKTSPTSTPEESEILEGLGLSPEGQKNVLKRFKVRMKEGGRNA